MLLASFGSLSAANLLDDPGFELATEGGQTTNSSWSLTANAPNGFSAAQFQGFAANSGSMGVWFKPFTGGEGNPLATATLSQSVAAAAGIYSLSFWAKRDGNPTADSLIISLSSDMGDLMTFDLLGGGVPQDSTFAQYSILNFVASAGTTSLTVQAIMTGGTFALSNPQSLMLDDFDLQGETSDVPEPGTLLLTGIGALLLLKRRHAV